MVEIQHHVIKTGGGYGYDILAAEKAAEKSLGIKRKRTTEPKSDNLKPQTDTAVKPELNDDSEVKDKEAPTPTTK